MWRAVDFGLATPVNVVRRCASTAGPAASAATSASASPGIRNSRFSFLLPSLLAMRLSITVVEFEFHPSNRKMVDDLRMNRKLDLSRQCHKCLTSRQMQRKNPHASNLPAVRVLLKISTRFFVVDSLHTESAQPLARTNL